LYKREEFVLEDKKILIVEDDPDHAELLIEGFNVKDIKEKFILMKDGQEVIDYFQEPVIKCEEEIQSIIGLIILDLNLPKIDGMEVLKFIKKNSKYCSIPVVVLSTCSRQETIDEAFKNGANGYFTKPASYEDLVEKIKILKKCY
jgi:two-component system response regulator